MQSTISLFRHLYDHLPPLFPEEVSEKIKHALEHAETDPSVTLGEIEDSMIIFGFEAWPWNQAYKEFLASAEGLVGEHFLLPRLSLSLQEKYSEFKHFGGTLRDLHSGRPADYFILEERSELCAALVEMQVKLREYVGRELVGLGKKKYLQRVEEFIKVRDDVKKQLDGLRMLADKEQDHPTLADEIRARVRAFEYSMCHLGQEFRYDAVCRATEFFADRKCHLNRMRGIHLPVEVDFYNTNYT